MTTQSKGTLAALKGWETRRKRAAYRASPMGQFMIANMRARTRQMVRDIDRTNAVLGILAK